MRSVARIGRALQLLRLHAGLTQEDFGVVSSRTYVSTVERGMKSPTLGKIEQLAEVLGVHPLALVALAYVDHVTPAEIERTIAHLREQLLQLTDGQ